MSVLAALLGGLADGRVEILDLTTPLSATTPVIELPEPFANTTPWALHELSRYDAGGPAWYWNNFSGGEHVGTHLDAPVHWVTGRHLDDVSRIPLRRLVGPAVVIDRTDAVRKDPDYLFTVGDVRAFEADHGPLPAGGWLLFRTGWGARAGDPAAFSNVVDGVPRSPGVDADCARRLAESTPIAGIGVETVGIDAGGAGAFSPPFPAHHHLLGAGKYGVTQLANLDRVPVTGAVVVVAPLPIVGGSGSPARVLAFVPAEI